MLHTQRIGVSTGAFLIFASAFGATSAAAGPDQISLLLGSEHVGASGFEEVNPGVFLTWREVLFGGTTDLSVGAYRNSYGRGSVAVSAAYPLIRQENFGLEVFSALALYPGDGDQFEYHVGDLVPLAGVQMRLGYAFVQAFPGGGTGVDATVSFGLTFPVK